MLIVSKVDGMLKVRQGVYHEQKKKKKKTLTGSSKVERLTVHSACYIYDIPTGAGSSISYFIKRLTQMLCSLPSWKQSGVCVCIQSHTRV